MPKPRKTLSEFFWARVNKSDGCWEWTGRKMYFGYGSIRLYRNAPQISSHRASWQIHFGEIPEGLCVLHRCDNPSCVRPDHLFLGTIQDNNMDAKQKGRAKVASKGWQRNKTHCKNGHVFDEANTYVYGTKRNCRICRAKNEANRRERKAAVL